MPWHGPEKDHEIHYKQVVNSISMLVPRVFLVLSGSLVPSLETCVLSVT